MLDQLIRRLNRYTRHCLAERLDPDFAEAVIDAIVYLKMILAMEKMKERTEHDQ